MDFASSHPDKGHPAVHPENRPLLAIDVDGVISLFGFDTSPPPEVARWELIDGTVYCLSLAASERILRLAEQFELVWATGWQDRANDRLSLLTGIGPLPVIEFDGHRAKGDASGVTYAHWKLGAVDEFCADRAVAWIDDSFDQSCFDWAETREANGSPTLLVPTEPDLGFEEAQAAAVADWADSLAVTD
ncbi:MAG: hypothetical protein KDB52_07785 [Solirubrobacterales bacterium]|nr:hypothetical protein [Solirubrobacterales bacterium]